MTDDEVPAALRAHLVALAADTVAEVDRAVLPAPLRRVASFAPAKRASAGAVPLWVALSDDGFRHRVARAWQQRHPALSDELAAQPQDVPASWEAAAGAWLLDGDWAALVPPSPREAPAGDGGVASARLTERVAHLTAELAAAAGRERALADELATMRRELRRLRSDADRARAQGRQATQEAEEALALARQEGAAASADRDRAAEDRRAAEAERTAARAELRVARRLADARVRLLLDTIVDAASGLRTELALPPAADLPADLVAPAQPGATARVGSRGRQVEDPALLDELLRQPRAHLVVDGYNVSKTAYGGLTLERQRRLVVDGLAALAARTGAEVTCCFDGQDLAVAPAASARGVRVLFSVGEIADDLIRRLVHAEPEGRVVVVVTSDQEVVRDVEARGAYVVPSATLVARLQRR
ncbi:NYN domain-containing protein [Cellulomonas sp. DKR-3]|uniref:NYN domain-containing protein n=1 Tax=Cellulomonas fulva TaxID=2835530 RepID=A0ABS5U0C2_9CELL|nr:NYN domain-containing protein [Cellulomonas fulva]MBT0994868.1 NYN domain-containing protein [Cellulomonas fulva]